MTDKSTSLRQVNEEIVVCRKCPRLVEYRERVAREKRFAYRDCIYWGKPVPGFGDPNAKLLIVGLAPGAHGSNRTGRVPRNTKDSWPDCIARRILLRAWRGGGPPRSWNSIIWRLSPQPTKYSNRAADPCHVCDRAAPASSISSTR